MSTHGIPVPPEHYGGIERVVANVGAGLVQGGHEVALLAAAGSRLDGAQCSFWANSGWIPDALDHGLQVLGAARRFRADLVHSFGQTKWLLPWCLSGGRAVISFGALPQPRTRQMFRLFREQLLLAGCSNYIADAGAALVAGRWRTAYNCLDMHRIEFAASVDPDAPLVFLSRIDANKGAHVAIEVAKKAGRRLIIAGNHAESGESGRYWRDVVQPLLEFPAVEYVGPVNDAQKFALLGRAAAMLVPIQWDEPFGVVFIEALACGTPVISCPRGALPEIVRDGVDGFLREGVDALAGAVARLEEIDRSACRRRAEDCFSTARIVDRYEHLYDELLDGVAA
ncbi:MAG: glycosyltransferase [Betaproteobacteria bacterium]